VTFIPVSDGLCAAFLQPIGVHCIQRIRAVFLLFLTLYRVREYLTIYMPVKVARRATRAVAIRWPACPSRMSGYAAAIMTASGMLDPDATVVSKPFTKAELLNAQNAALMATVLVADDYPVNRELMVALLGDHGYTVPVGLILAARGLAPRGGMAQPLGRGLRPRTRGYVLPFPEQCN
jgi:hypothetical protein